MSATSTQTRNTFTPDEITYLQSQRLGRIATVGPNGHPHVVPVGFRYNPETRTIDVGGHGIAGSKKWRDALNHPRVAIVIDDLASVNPWRARGVEIRGEAQALLSGGETIGPGFAPEMLRITPKRIVSWGINPDARRE